MCGLLTAVSCRRAAEHGRTTIDVRIDGGAGRDLTLYEMRANTGTVTIATVRLDKRGEGRFRFENDSLSLYALQTAETVSTGTDAGGADLTSAVGRTGDRTPLVLFPAVGGTLHVEADYTDLVGSARLTDAANVPLDSLQILPFQREQQTLAQLNRDLADYWAEMRYEPDARRIYDSIVQLLDSRYRTQKTESLRLAAQFPQTLIPIYLAQLSFGNRPLFDAQDTADLRILADWAAELQRQLPGNPHVERFADNIRRLEQWQRLQALQNERTRDRERTRRAQRECGQTAGRTAGQTPDRSASDRT